MAESNELRTDEWIEGVLEGAPEGATVLVAYVSERKTIKRRHVRRLYSSAALNDYVEVLEDDIVAHRKLPEANSPLGGSVVWLRPDAHVKRIQTATRQAQAGMLAGNDFAQVAAGQGDTFTRLGGIGAQTTPQLTPVTPVTGGGVGIVPFALHVVGSTPHCYTTSRLAPCIPTGYAE